MPTPGFPDWQRIVSWVGPAVFRHQSVVLDGAGSWLLGSNVSVSSYRGVLIAASADANPVWLTIGQRIDDTAGLVGIGTPIYIPALTSVVIATDAWSQFMTASLSGTAAAQPSIGIWPTNLPPGCYPPAGDETLLAFQSTGNIANGASKTIDLGPYTGRITVYVGALAAQAANASIQTLNLAGTQFARTYLGSIVASGFVIAEAYLPAGRNQLVVSNLGAAPAAWNVNVTPEYHAPH